MTTEPTVSVVVTHWNHTKLLRAALDSLTAQTVPPAEVIIVDDGTEDAPSVSAVIASCPVRPIVVYLPHRGIGSALNTAVSIMRANVLCWLPADDLWMPNKLERQREFAERHSDCVLHSFCEVWENDSYARPGIVPELTDEEMAVAIRHSSPYYANTFWIPKDILDRVGKFREDVIASEDYEWVLRSVVLHGVKYRLQPEMLTVKRRHAETTTVRHSEEVIRLVQQFNDEVGSTCKLH
ncbi:MAG: glycosyltransferase family 2 protein [bacterium]